MGFYRFARGLVNFFIRIVFRLDYIGRENIPQQGGYIVVSNHCSGYDPLFLACGMKPQIHFMAKAELLRMPVVGFILRHAGVFGVERGKGDTTAVDNAINHIKNGGVVGMFPEGTRAPTEQPLRPRSGAAHIAGASRADILPCAVYFKGKMGPGRRVVIAFGPLIPHEQLGMEGVSGSAALRSAMGEMWGAVMKLREDAIKALG